MNNDENNNKNLDQLMSDIRNRIDQSQKKAYLKNKGVSPDEKGNYILDQIFPRTLFNKDYRNMPNDLARCSLFTARDARAKREYFQQKPLFHLSSNVELLYTGEELCARDDELIWLQLVYYSRKSPLGKYIQFGIMELIKDIGWPATGQSYDKARRSLSRLHANEIYIRNTTSYGVSGAISLIKEYVGLNDSKSKNPTRYLLSIDPNLIALFAGNTFSNVPWEKYKKLTPMARRLADYALSHKEPLPLPVNKFLSLCGSDLSTESKTQARAARRACEKLVESDLVRYAWVKNGEIRIMRFSKNLPKR